MMIDDGVNRNILAEGMTAGVGLTVNHDNRFAWFPVNFVDGNQIEVEQINHRPVFGPADMAISSNAGRQSQARLYQVSQADHAAQAVWVGLHMRNKGDSWHVAQTSQEAVGSTSQGGPTINAGFGAVAWHELRILKRQPTLALALLSTVQIIR